MKKKKREACFTVWKEKRKNKRGYVLAEVTVTLALTLMLAAAALFFLKAGVEQYRRIRAAAAAIEAGDRIFAVISDAIRQAGPDSAAEVGNTEEECQVLALSGPDGTVRIAVSEEKDRLVLTGLSGDQEEWPADSRGIPGCRIEELSFRILESGEGERLIQVQMELEDPDTGFSFRSSRIAVPGEN